MRTDVFAMGALVYVLLTGRVPAAGQQIQLSHSIPAVPVAVDGVLTKALAVNPEERYPSLLEMNRDLRVALRAPRAVTRPSTPAPRRVEAAHGPQIAVLALRWPQRAQRPTRPPATTPDGFPEQLPMPDIDFSSLNQALEMPAVEAWVKIEIPPAPEIPKVDWAELLHLVDVSAYSSEIISLPYAAAETLAPDPMVAAAMAVKATEQTQQSRQRAARQPAETAPRPQSRAAAQQTATPSQAAPCPPPVIDLADLLSATGGRLHGPAHARRFSSFLYDSRLLAQPGDQERGQSGLGPDFRRGQKRKRGRPRLHPDAIARGASGVLCQQPLDVAAHGVTCVVVADTRAALTAYAAPYPAAAKSDHGRNYRLGWQDHGQGTDRRRAGPRVAARCSTTGAASMAATGCPSRPASWSRSTSWPCWSWPPTASTRSATWPL